MRRFLSSGEPEVLSVSGRWGVGKTHAWDEVLAEVGTTSPLKKYAYVSVFGLRSLDDLKIAIVQSTVALDSDELEPTVESFRKHLSSFDGLRNAGETAIRRSFPHLTKGASALPVVGHMSDLLTSGASLLIRNQIICIDDIERARSGLEISDILGLVSSLRERKGCKIVLMLNEEGLGDQTEKFAQYREKVVDQAVFFSPSSRESANAVLNSSGIIDTELVERVAMLGIVNIRVIKRIRRTITHLEPMLKDRHVDLSKAVVKSMALLGWCVFEPGQAPSLEQVQGGASLFRPLPDGEPSKAEEAWGQISREYDFWSLEKLDEEILSGLQLGAFDLDALRTVFDDLEAQFADTEAIRAINSPWHLYADSFDDNHQEVVQAFVSSVEDYGRNMEAAQATNIIDFLNELGETDEAERILTTYLKAQDGKSRDFFAASLRNFHIRVDQRILDDFERRLDEIPVNEHPADVLLRVSINEFRSDRDIAYLASVPTSEYYDILKRFKGTELSVMVNFALKSENMGLAIRGYSKITERMKDALRQVAQESSLNELRAKLYLKK
ncbi:hypothetical protein SAMN05428995_105216 [Loktanella sp. DSM 29012]|nr:hypothetical protein SAMN05428995_105216 [Loktanella sp. DSM 29012]